MQTKLEKLISQYRELGIDKQIDYDKFYLYSLITHSTAIEGSTITELENQIMFDQGISLKGKSIAEQTSYNYTKSVSMPTIIWPQYTLGRTGTAEWPAC